MTHVRRSAHETPGPLGDWGAECVREMMRDLTFPMTREELVARAGRWRVALPGELDTSLGDLLTGDAPPMFTTALDVVRAVRDHAQTSPAPRLAYHRPFDSSRESTDRPAGADDVTGIPNRGHGRPDL